MTQSAKTRFGFHTASPITTAFEATTCDFVSSKPLLMANGNRGTRSRMAARKIEGVEDVRGTIVCSPSPEEVALWLPWIGFLNTAGTFTLTEALTSRYVTIDKIAKVPTYSGCYVNSLTIRMVKGAPWEWTFDIIGQQESLGNAGTFPSIDVVENPPMALHHSVLTLLGSARSVEEITLKFDNLLEVESNNATYNEQIEPSDRNITADFILPATVANQDLQRGSLAGDASTLALTYGGYSMAFNFAALQFPRGGIGVSGKGGMKLQLNGEAGATEAGDEVEIVLDSTP